MKIKKFLAVIATLFTTLSAFASAPITNEFWIATNPTGNLYPSGARGTIDNPLDGSTQFNFDTNMMNLPQNATIHILAGTFQTRGFFTKSYQHIVGSGIDVTTIQFVTNLYVGGSGCTIISNVGPTTNTEVSDMTLDCNSANTLDTYHGIGLNGTENAVRRVSVINCARFAGNSEAWAIVLCNFNLTESTGNIIEGCKVSHYRGGTANESAICLLSGGPPQAAIGGIIRDNLVIGDGPDAYPGVLALVFGSSRTLVEGNHVVGVNAVFHAEAGSYATNIIIAHNFFDNCFHVLELDNMKNITFAYNNVELATNATSAVIYGGNTTNLTITGNTVSIPNLSPGDSSDHLFIQMSSGSGLLVSDNTLDSHLINAIALCSNVNMENNFDLFGNYFSGMNNPTVGGYTVSPFMLTMFGTTSAGTAVTTLGLPAATTILTNNSTQSVNFSNNMTLNGNIYLPPSTSARGIVYSGSAPMLIATTNNNFFAGPWAGNLTTTNTLDTAVGYAAGSQMTGTANSAFGSFSMYGASAGQFNSAFGYYSMNNSPSGQDNCAFGANSMQLLTSGNYNTVFGAGALFAATAINNSTAIGCGALGNITSGEGSTAVGFGALGSCVTNNSLPANTAIGNQSLGLLIAGGNNIAVGYGAGFNPTNGDNNIYIGHRGIQGDNNVIRIGTPGTQTDAYLAGTVRISALTLTNAGSVNWASMSVSPSNAVISVQGVTVAVLQTNGVLNAYNGLSTTVSNTAPPSVVSMTGTGVAWTNTTPWNIVAYVSSNTNNAMENVYYNGSTVFTNVFTSTMMLKPGAVFSATNASLSLNIKLNWHPF